jgi:5'-nucleotidase
LGVRILHTNDLHGRLDKRRLERLCSLRREADLYLDSGDGVKSGNLAVPVSPDPVWERLAEARCTASVIGNRETHLMERAFWAKLSGARHPVLAANLRRKDGTRPLPGSLVTEAGGLAVGVVGVSVAMVTERMAASMTSAFLWEDPVRTALDLASELRPQVSLLIALTHIGHQRDLVLAESCQDIDVVLGGHSHTVFESPVRVGRTYVCQGGSHGRYLGRYVWSEGELSGGLEPWI